MDEYSTERALPSKKMWASLFVTPIYCGLASVVRIFLIILFAIEDFLRLIICSVMNLITSCLQIIRLIPWCITYYCTSSCCCCPPCCSPSCCYPGNSCTLCFIIIVIVILLLLYYTTWIQDTFARLSRMFWKKATVTRLRETNPNEFAVSNIKMAQTNVNAADYYANDNNDEKRSTQLITVDAPAAVARWGVKNELNSAYVDKLKEKAFGIPVDNRHTFATTISNGVFEEFVNGDIKNNKNDFKKLFGVFLKRSN